MTTERLRSRDGGNQRSDGQHRPSSPSKRTFDLSRINAERNYANSVQSGENRGKREHNPNTDKSINERGKPTENQIPLATNYSQGNPGLKGGMESGGSSDSGDSSEKVKKLLAQSERQYEETLNNQNITIPEDHRRMMNEQLSLVKEMMERIKNNTDKKDDEDAAKKCLDKASELSKKFR
jgi:hypothetical protein